MGTREAYLASHCAIQPSGREGTWGVSGPVSGFVGGCGEVMEASGRRGAGWKGIGDENRARGRGRQGRKWTEKGAHGIREGRGGIWGECGEVDWSRRVWSYEENETRRPSAGSIAASLHQVSSPLIDAQTVNMRCPLRNRVPRVAESAWRSAFAIMPSATTIHGDVRTIRRAFPSQIQGPARF